MIGTLLVTRTDEHYFAASVPWLILGAAFLFSLQPLVARLVNKKPVSAMVEHTTSQLAVLAFAQLLVSIYGGYFGAGIGTFAERVRQSGMRVSCVEPDARQAEAIVEKGITVYPNLDSISEESIDFLYSLNVLEHIEDDAKALSELYRILKPGAVAVLEVPAGPRLYDMYDELLRHYRRYSMGSFGRLVKGAGFETAWRSHLGFFLYPAFVAGKVWNRLRFRRPGALRREQVAAQIKNSRGAGIIDQLMRFERWSGRYLYLPFGIRCLVVARKPVPATSKA